MTKPVANRTLDELQQDPVSDETCAEIRTRREGFRYLDKTFFNFTADEDGAILPLTIARAVVRVFNGEAYARREYRRNPGRHRYAARGAQVDGTAIYSNAGKELVFFARRRLRTPSVDRSASISFGRLGGTTTLPQRSVTKRYTTFAI